MASCDDKELTFMDKYYYPVMKKMASKKRLIDASFENAKEVLEKVPYYPDEIWKFAAMAERFPTVDAVEVVHGRWTYTDGEYEIYMICSECGWDSDFRTNYCPNCGAKMDGDGNGE